MMFSVLIIMICLMARFDLSAQLSVQERLDSLIAEIPNAKSDTNHVKLLNNISYGLNRINPEKGIEYGLQGLELSKKIKWDKGIAKSNNAVGNNYQFLSDYEKALEYLYESRKLEEKLGDKNRMAALIADIAKVYIRQSKYSEALELYLNSVHLSEEMNNQRQIADNLGNIGIIYYFQSDFDKALEYYQKSIKIKKEIGDSEPSLSNLINIGYIYLEKKESERALEYFEKSLKIGRKLKDQLSITTSLISIGNIYKMKEKYAIAVDYYGQALGLYQEIGNKRGVAMIRYNIANVYLDLSNVFSFSVENKKSNLRSLKKNENLSKSIMNGNKSLELFVEMGDARALIQVYDLLHRSYYGIGKYQKAYLSLLEHKKFKDSVFNLEAQEKIANLISVREKEVAEKETEILLQKNKLSEIELAKNKIQIYASVSGVVFLSIFGIVIFRQRQKSENLLLNILPQKIADRLKKKEKPIADYFDLVSIVFMDMVGFTEYSKLVSPHELVGLLNKIFIIFDEIALRHGLEKIKTIGDCYMAVCGIPEPNPRHAENVMNFAIEANKALENIKMRSGEAVKFRTGVESGAVVAGVIGSNKFIYDLWGEAVNTASRMESHGQVGKIQMTDNFKNELEKQSALKYDFQKRGEIEIQGGMKINAWYLN